MRPPNRNKTLLAVAATAAGLALPAGQGAADHRPDPFDTVATVTACQGDSLTVAAQIAPAKGRASRRAVKRAKRALRRATLRVRFEAAPLYGPTRRSREIKLGRTTTARRFFRFSDLAAQSYTGIVRYRWVRGSRTVMSGVIRTRKGRVAGRRGRPTCSLGEGRRPVDTTPPFIAPIPSDSAWRRGPLTVQFYAVDDLSGVALVASRVDGGSFQRGRRIEIPDQGAHRVEYVARDAAGNQSALAAATLRVDTSPPTRPVITAPTGTTAATQPDITWSAATDSASGVAGYLALVRDAQGAIVWSQAVSASTTSVTVGEALAAGSYTAEVTAFDNTSPQPFTATGTGAFTVAG